MPNDTTIANSLQQLVASALVDDHQTGTYQVRRDIFTDPDLFELEMKHIFESNWVFLAHESQIPNPNDYFTTYIGRQPVVITRDKHGQLHALINACAHRGAMLCRRRQGNKGSFTCPFHGWTFGNDGKLLKVKDGKTGNYPASFDVNGSHNMRPVARFENYRGFLFGSVNTDVLPLVDHLGSARVVIDQIVDQAPQGLEVLRGSSSYFFDGNWKLQIENGADGYHVSSVHWNYVATMQRQKESGRDKHTIIDVKTWSKNEGGIYGFEHGHLLLWTKLLNPEARPVFAHRDELVARLGEQRTDVIINQSRNLCLYPNLYVMDQLSSQFRVVRPISVDRTEVTAYCFGPKGESQQERTLRIRQYEDFFNVSGMGTPDDLEEFRACQVAYMGISAEWNDLSRGATEWIRGPDENAKATGLAPLLSGTRTEDEGLFVQQHTYWKERLQRAFAKQGDTDDKVAA